MSKTKLKEKTRAKKEEKKSKKRKHEVVDDDAANAPEVESVPAPDEEEAIEPEIETVTEEKPKKRSKKRKLDADGASDPKSDSEKKQKKLKKQKKHDTNGAAPEEDEETTECANAESSQPEIQNGTTDKASGKSQQRFIVFIGNLPYTATDETIRKHFSALLPFQIRNNTDKKTTKSKGFAFLEFEQYDRMKTCLKLYHHTQFDDGKSPARKINVELTAGGGGKSENRQKKLKEKNERLRDQRRRRMEHEEKQKQRSEKKKQKNSEENHDATPVNGGDNGADASHDGIHPSRRAMLAR